MQCICRLHLNSSLYIYRWTAIVIRSNCGFERLPKKYARYSDCTSKTERVLSTSPYWTHAARKATSHIPRSDVLGRYALLPAHMCLYVYIWFIRFPGGLSFCRLEALDLRVHNSALFERYSQTTLSSIIFIIVSRLGSSQILQWR